MASFSINKLANHLKQTVPEINFAFIFGSSSEGSIKKYSDVDIAVYLNTEITVELILKIITAVETITGANCDLNILNTASEILRFEVLKGKLLFVRNSSIDNYAKFYSLTCREYEDKMAWMNKQMTLRGYA